MVNYFLAWAVILIVGTIILYFIMKNVLRVVVTSLFILFLFIAITATLTYSDVQELRQDLQEKEIVFIVQDQEEYLFGLVKYTKDDEKMVKKISLSESDLVAAISKEEYQTILEAGNYYKVILLEKSVFSVLPEEITGKMGTKTTASVFAILSDDSFSFDDRAFAFNDLLAALQEQEGMLYLLQEYQKEEVIIYPKTMFFRILESLPFSVVEKVIPDIMPDTNNA